MKSKTIVSKYKSEWNRPPQMTPADKSVDGPLMGNGDMGVALTKDGREHRFILCKNDLWRLAHQYGTSCPVPLGNLGIFVNGFANSSYEVTQDLYTATTTGVFELLQVSLTMTSYVAATRNLLLVELSTTGKAVDARASLSISGDRGAETRTGRTGEVFWGQRAFTEGVGIPSGAAAAWKVLSDTEVNLDGSFLVTPGKPVTLVLAMDSVFKHEDYLEQAIASVSDLSDEDALSNIREDHESWWAEYWEKCYVSISDPVIEKQYYLSLYGMGSCSRDPDFPPAIFGWTTTDDPLWAGDYHLNYNHQAPFYGLSRANRLEQADPHDTPFLDFMDRAAWHCREMYGHDGGIYPVGIGPKGIETTYNSRRFTAEGPTCAEHGGLFFGQRTNGSYGLVNMAQRWRTTYDLAYGKKVYPFVLQMATFWENYLTWEPFENAVDGKSGRYVIEKDSCHEGSGEDLNSCVALALCQLALELALDIGATLEQDAERRASWEHILEHLSVGSLQEKEGKTVFKYTEKGTDWWPSNTIGIQHIYPAGQIDLDSDPELLQVARNTLEVMRRWHDTNGSNSFFPAAVRVGYQPETILKELRIYSENARPNGFQEGNPHGIENYSTVPNTINEMLCMGHKGLLRIFPVWPKNRNASFVNIRCWGAFLVSGKICDGVIQKVTIYSEKGTECNVINPWPENPVQIIRNGEAAEVVEGNSLIFKTIMNENIELEPTEKKLIR